MTQFVMGVHAIVIRSPESYLKIWCEKLSILPWGEAGFQRWLDAPDERIGGRTPRQSIADGDGYVAEAIVDELEHLHFAMMALESMRGQYGGLRLLSEVWDALERAKENLPWSTGG